MTLTEKIEKAGTCQYCNWERSHNGNCNKDGYAPYDCEKCSSYKKKSDSDYQNKVQ
jgi:hypothetical protein